MLLGMKCDSGNVWSVDVLFFGKVIEMSFCVSVFSVSWRPAVV